MDNGQYAYTQIDGSPVRPLVLTKDGYISWDSMASGWTFTRKLKGFSVTIGVQRDAHGFYRNYVKVTRTRGTGWTESTTGHRFTMISEARKMFQRICVSGDPGLLIWNT